MIKIAGTTIKTPSDYQLGVMTLTKDPQRNANGSLITEVIAVKRKIELQWKSLTSTEAELIRSLAKNPASFFFLVEYPETDGTLTTKTMYASDYILKAYTYIGSTIIWKDVTLSLVEQ